MNKQEYKVKYPSSRPTVVDYYDDDGYDTSPDCGYWSMIAESQTEDWVRRELRRRLTPHTECEQGGIDHSICSGHVRICKS